MGNQHDLRQARPTSDHSLSLHFKILVFAGHFFTLCIIPAGHIPDSEKIYIYIYLPQSKSQNTIVVVDNPILNLYMEKQKTQCSQHNIERKDKVSGLTLPNFKTYFKAPVIKTV